MKEMLERWIRHLNTAIDNAPHWEDFHAGEIRAYIDTICDLSDELHIKTEIDPKSGHMYIK